MNPSPFPTSYEEAADTPSGRSFVEKYLHPPGAARTPLAGIPDRDCMSSSTPEMRWDNTVRKPSALSDPGTWNCLMLVNNHPDASVLYWKWDASGAFDFSEPPTVLTNNSVDLSNASRLMNSSRTMYRSHTMELDAPKMFDQGHVYTAQIVQEPGNAEIELAGITGKPLIDCDVIRPSLYPIGDGNGIMQMSSNSYEGSAREGVFMPMRYRNPSLQYKPLRARNIPKPGLAYVSNPPAGTAVKKWILGTNASHPDPQFYDPDTYTTQADVVRWSMPPDDMTSGWVLWTGIASEASIRIKTIEALEARTTPGSAWQPFLTDGAYPDARAMDSCYRLRSTMADAFPARYNLFGSFFNSLKNLAPKLLDLASSEPAQAVLGMVPGGNMINSAVKVGNRLRKAHAGQQKAAQGKSKKNRKNGKV